MPPGSPQCAPNAVPCSLRYDRRFVRCLQLVIAEGILIGLVACVVSLVFGILAGWCGAGISGHISFFGGMPLELVIPWGAVLAGMAAVLVLSSLAAAWPAFSLGRAKPLNLLQQGRGSF